MKRRDDGRQRHYIIDYIIDYIIVNKWRLVSELNFCWETKISRNLKGLLNWLTSGRWDWSSRLVYSLVISWLLERINVTRTGHGLIPDQSSWTSDETLQVKLVPTHINNVTTGEPVHWVSSWSLYWWSITSCFFIEPLATKVSQLIK